jgi:hypothetical protein
VTLQPHVDRLEGDWSSFVQSLTQPSSQDLDLRRMKAGDLVLVKTRNTLYLLEWKTADSVELRTNKTTRPGGLVRIMGCTFGHSSSIQPDFLSCGGNLELTYNEGHRTWTTSPIDEIHHLHRTGS